MRLPALGGVAVAALVLAGSVSLAVAQSSQQSRAPGFTEDEEDALQEAEEQAEETREKRRKDSDEKGKRERSRIAHTDEQTSDTEALELAEDRWEEILTDEGAAKSVGSEPGERVERWLSDHAAVVRDENSKVAVVESSLGPLRPTEGTTFDLGLDEAGAEFEPKRSAAELKLPKDLTEGIKLPRPNIRLTPVADDTSGEDDGEPSGDPADGEETNPGEDEGSDGDESDERSKDRKRDDKKRLTDETSDGDGDGGEAPAADQAEEGDPVEETDSPPTEGPPEEGSGEDPGSDASEGSQPDPGDNRDENDPDTGDKGDSDKDKKDKGARGRKVGRAVGWSKVWRDTDVLALPHPGGVQLLAQIRSIDSPEELAFEVELPEGAELEGLEGGEEGVRVVRGKKLLAMISPPMAFDSDGEAVPTTMLVDGDRIVLTVEHRQGDLRYPLLVDPIVTSYDSWFAGSSTGATADWAAAQNPPGRFESRNYTGNDTCYTASFQTNPYCVGLYQFSNPDKDFQTGDNAYYMWFAPGQTAYITRAEFLNASMGFGGNTNHPLPDTFAGIASATLWLGYVNRYYQFYNQNFDIRPVAGLTEAQKKTGRYAFFMLHFDEGGHRNKRTHNYLGGARLYVEDPEAPSLSVTGASTNWLREGDITATATASDPGLGLYSLAHPDQTGAQATERIRVSPDQPGGGTNPECLGSRPRVCPNSAVTRSYATSTSNLPEGVNTLEVTARDPLGSADPAGHERRASYQAKVDRTPPAVQTSGTLKDHNGQFLPNDDTYTLTANATDQSPLGPRAGVQKIDILENGVRVDGATQECPNGSCPLSHTYTFAAATKPDGTYRVQAVATDIAGNSSSSSVLDETTIKVDRSPPVVVLTGTLWDRRNQTEDHRFEGLYDAEYALTAVATDGTTEPGDPDQAGVDSIAIAVDGVEKYRSLPQTCIGENCPLEANWILRPDDYPEGPHSITVTAADRLGRVSTSDFVAVVDRTGDVFAAKAYAGNPADQDVELLTREWGQPSTLVARSESDTRLAGRSRVSCNKHDDGCDVVRKLHRLEPGASDNESTYTKTKGKAGSKRIQNISSILPVADEDEEEPEGEGPILDVLEVWQHPPPTSGTQFERYDHKERIDGERVSVQTYVDAVTKMPLKAVHRNDDGTTVALRFWSYDVERTFTTDHPVTFFCPKRPGSDHAPDCTEDDTGDDESIYGQEIELGGEDLVGNVLDGETLTSFGAYGLGLVRTVLTGGGSSGPPLSRSLCLASTDVVRTRTQDVGANQGGQGDPTLPPAQALKDQTFVFANYVFVGSQAVCSPGGMLFDKADVDVVTLARGSTEATAWRQTIGSEAGYLQTNGTATERETGGLLPMTLGGEATTAYVVPHDDGGVTALLDLDGSTVLVTGPFTTETLPNVLQVLEPR